MVSVNVTNQVPNYFIDLYKNNKITFNTEYQRGPVWNLKKKQKLIDSMINGWSIGEIVLRRKENNIYEVLDGQQRLRTIFEFEDGIKGKDPSGYPKCYVTSEETTIFPNKTYKKLQKNHKLFAKFLSCTIPVATIENADEPTTCKIFLRLQEGVALNAPEKLNAMLGNIRNDIVEFSRQPIFKKTKLDEKRFGYRYTCAQIALLELYKNFDHLVFPDIKLKNLQELYNKYSKRKTPAWLKNRVKKILRILDKQLGTETQIIKNRMDMISFYLLVSYIDLKYAKQKNMGLDKFTVNFLKEVENIDPKIRISDANEEKRPFAEYRYFRSTGALSSKSLKQRIDVIIGSYLKFVSNLELKDVNRFFDYGQKLAIYIKDERKCQKCGKKVEFKNAAFHHKKWWSKGGPTTVENGQLMHEKCHHGCHCEDERE